VISIVFLKKIILKYIKIIFFIFKKLFFILIYQNNFKILKIILKFHRTKGVSCVRVSSNPNF